MLVFGVDVPLVEIVFIMAIVIFIILVEVIIIVSLMIKQMNKAKQLSQLVENLSQTILEIKKAEISELDKLNRS